MTQSLVLRPQSSVVLVECPRDSWQGFARFIPSDEKIAYLRRLIDAGFTHIDFGSFVSPKLVPQMKDTEEVFAGIRQLPARFIAIIANERGLDRALAAGVTCVAYPLSISETFQKSNTGKTISESWSVLEAIARRAPELDVHLSMAFGNPYGEPWSVSLLKDTVARVRDLGPSEILLADTIGRATPEQIWEVFAACPGTGAHLHASPTQWRANVEAALEAGCARIDSALGGIGGCPFAQDELVGNIPTEGLRDVDPALVKEAKRLYEKYH
jgi:hydroxymethylglutaryl-CoA lyase